MTVEGGIFAQVGEAGEEAKERSLCPNSLQKEWKVGLQI